MEAPLIVRDEDDPRGPPTRSRGSSDAFDAEDLAQESSSWCSSSSCCPWIAPWWRARSRGAREVTQVVRDRVFPRETEVLVVGIEASGKTALVRALEGTAFTGASIPTVGFQIRKIQRSGLVVKVWDLGGQRRFRAMWHRYAGGVKVVLYVVDAAAEDTWDEAAGALTSLLAAESSWGIPLAVLANKVDALGDLEFDATGLREALHLEQVNDRELAVLPVSARTGRGLDGLVAFLDAHAARPAN